MKITKEWLKEKNACISGVKWFLGQDKTDSIEVLEELAKQDKLSDANWLIVRIMNYRQYVSYAVFAAENVIDVYENIHPGDGQPRKAIEAAKKCIDDPSKENKRAAAAAAYAADAAYAAAYASDAAYAAADAAYASDAAYAAYDAAAYAADAAYAAAYASDAAYAAYDAADAARKEMRIRILDFGINLLKGDV